jgi:hypothetical protein
MLSIAKRPHISTQNGRFPSGYHLWLPRLKSLSKRTCLTRPLFQKKDRQLLAKIQEELLDRHEIYSNIGSDALTATAVNAYCCALLWKKCAAPERLHKKKAHVKALTKNLVGCVFA